MIFEIFTTIVLPTVLVVILAVVLGRRPRAASGDSDSDSVGFSGGVISALFTVVLAFYIVFAWQLGADIGSASDVEANALVDISAQAESLPAGQRDAVRSMTVQYAQRVADREWPLLAQGRLDPVPGQLVRALRAEFTALPADDNVMQSTRDNGLADLRQLDESHRARVALATGSDVFNDVLLTATLFGAALTVAFPLLIGLSGRPSNIAVMAILTLTIGAVVYIALQLTHPLDGLFATEPDAFREALEQMRPSAT